MQPSNVQGSKLDLQDLTPLIVSPRSGHRSTETTTTSSSQQQQQPLAFILLPGTFLYPKDYKHLIQALEDSIQRKPLLHTTWLAVAPVDWTKINPATLVKDLDTAIETTLQALDTAGFPTKPSLRETATESGHRSDRLNHVIVGAHSASSVGLAGFPFHKAGAAVLLGGTLFAVDTFFPSIHCYPRPILQVHGALDGQDHHCRAALCSIDAATLGPVLGLDWVAVNRPIAVIQGMNHAQFSNGIINTTRGDLEPEVDADVALREVADIVTSFFILHSSIVLHETKDNHSQAISQSIQLRKDSINTLKAATIQAAKVYAAYSKALGRPSAEELLSLCSLSDNTQNECNRVPLRTSELVYARGAEVLPLNAQSHVAAFTVHPGEIAAAEQFTLKAQRRLLSLLLPPEIVDRIRIGVTVHTSIESFMYSQPTILVGWEDDDAGSGVPNDKKQKTLALLHVHAHIHRESYPEHIPNIMMRDPKAALSPVYSLKLKSGRQVAGSVGGVALQMRIPQAEPPQKGTFSSSHQIPDKDMAVILSYELFEEALVLVGSCARDRFQQKGHHLDFKLSTSSCEMTPPQWVVQPIVIEENTWSCHLPHVETGNDFSTPSSHRFDGAVYFKVPSLAWMMEWILVRGLRT